MRSATPSSPGTTRAAGAWRSVARRDPYAVLVSEVMAQQTQISRVAAAWTAFMATFPTIRRPRRRLAGRRAAGLARDRLQPAGAEPVARRAGRRRRARRRGCPTDVAALERLPGIGPYTARAVAAIAFGSPVGAVDTNVRRVLGRAVGGRDDAFPAERAAAARRQPSCPRTDRPTGRTRSMDVGATFCRTTRPRCAECPAMAGAGMPRARRSRAPRRPAARERRAASAPRRAGSAAGSSIASARGGRRLGRARRPDRRPRRGPPSREALAVHGGRRPARARRRRDPAARLPIA